MSNSDFKEFLRYAADFYYNGFKSFIPWTPKQKKNYLEKIESLKDLYQPMMEKKTGISLGNVKVKRHRELSKDIYYETVIEKIDEKIRKKENDVEEIEKLGFSLKTVYPLLSFVNSFMNQAFGGARFHKNTIYMPTGFGNRFEEYVKKDLWDSTVVHELSHALWGSIEGERSIRDHKNWRMWNEGFATYCEENYFLDLYKNKLYDVCDDKAKHFLKNTKNPNAENDLTKIAFLRDGYGSNSVYRKGKRKIENILEKHGENVLLDIPKKWDEFEREISF